MRNRKLFCILLAILMLLSLLGGCQSVEVTPTTSTTATPSTMPTTEPSRVPYDYLTAPPEITEKHIDTFYLRAQLFQTKDTQLCFFGAFDGAYAILIRDKAKSCEPCWETVNGLTFYYPDGYAIYLENDEAFDLVGGHLWEMFNRKLITEAQLQEIYDNYYSVYPELLYLANGQLDFGAEEMEAISKALLPITGEEVDWDDVNTHWKPSPRLVYYCSIMGAHVFRWIPYYPSAFLEYQSIYVGSYRFMHKEFFQIYVYVGDELWTLEEAYNRNFFSDAEIEIIYRYHVTASRE